jgi:hypothetical protein
MAKRAETVADSSPCGGWTLEHDAGHLISATGASDACPPAGRAPCPTARRGVPGREATVHVPQCALEPHQRRRAILHHVPRCRRRRVKRKAKKRTAAGSKKLGTPDTIAAAPAILKRGKEPDSNNRIGCRIGPHVWDGRKPGTESSVWPSRTVCTRPDRRLCPTTRFMSTLSDEVWLSVSRYPFDNYD